jgi:hypothetical protein
MKYYIDGLCIRETSRIEDKQKAREILQSRVFSDETGAASLAAISAVWRNAIRLYAKLETSQQKKFRLITTEILEILKNANFMLKILLREENINREGEEEDGGKNKC